MATPAGFIRQGKAYDCFLLYATSDKKHADVACRELGKLSLNNFDPLADISWGNSETESWKAFNISSVIGVVLSESFFADSSRMNYLDAALRTKTKPGGRNIVCLLIKLTESKAVQRCPFLTNCKNVKLLRYQGISDYSTWAAEVQKKCEDGVSRCAEAELEARTIEEKPDVQALLNDMKMSIDNVDFQVESLITLKNCALKGPCYQTLILDHGGIELIVKILERFNTKTRIYRHGLATIASTSWKRDDVRKLARKCGAVARVLHAFERFKEMPDVAQEACACTKNLGIDRENCQRLVDGSVTKHILDVFRRRRDHLLLQRWTCAALHTTCGVSDGIKEFLEQKGLEVVMQAMNFRHERKRDSVQQKWTCRLSTRLAASSGEVRHELIARGLRRECFAIQVAFPASDEAHQDATQTLRILDNKAPIGSFRGLLDVNSLFLDFVSKEAILGLAGLQEELHWVLREGRSVFQCSGVQSYTLSKMIAVSDSTQNDIIQFEGFEYIVEVMKTEKFRHNADVQEKACWCLSAFCKDHDANKKHATSCGALKSVLDTIEQFLYHPDNGNPHLFQKAFTALVKMSEGVDTNKTFIGERNGIASILNAMESFHCSAEVTHWGVAVLATVCRDNKENTGKIVTFYGVERLVETLKEWLSDEMTVLWVSRTIRNMSIVEGVIKSFCDNGAKDYIQKALDWYSSTETKSSLQECLRLLLEIDNPRESEEVAIRHNFTSKQQDASLDSGYSDSVNIQ
eukprot:m.202643 g.202643  ORF g.202643 m.202643 type:complete len:745 (+) comp39615_c0_seq10:81-2315(+)